MCRQRFGTEPRELFTAIAIREAVCTEVVIDLVVLDVTLIDAGVILGLPPCSRRFVVHCLERRTSGGKLAAGRERRDDLFVVENLVGRVAQSSATTGDRLRVDRRIADDQLVGVFRMLEVEEQPFLLHQPQCKR
ncbi:hypothetical protein WJ12_00055 [Burkholderia seminalis]|nr:hypothetical protein WJ12_00055 [Burkholderia seminalis]